MQGVVETIWQDEDGKVHLHMVVRRPGSPVGFEGMTQEDKEEFLKQKEIYEAHLKEEELLHLGLIEFEQDDEKNRSR